jgi:hypothetical protein
MKANILELDQGRINILWRNVEIEVAIKAGLKAKSVEPATLHPDSLILIDF